MTLGHEITTDVVRLTFDRFIGALGDDLWVAMQSLAQALIPAAAIELEIPATDLNAVVACPQQGPSSIVLYDDVPGGAGLVARLEDEGVLRQTLTTARELTDGHCGCAPDTSCYECLRSYRNRYLHEDLHRGKAFELLSDLLKDWPQ